MAELTPMMQQYTQMKERNPDCLLFFRLGDFYEMFQEDAKIASRELDLTLTTRDRGKDKEDQTPMCGVPYHSSEAYIARLVAKGYKVAICEQTEDPAKAKGLVRREIVRVVTPGTVTESSMLDETRNNYYACVYGEDGQFGLCFCDVSTGVFSATFAENGERLVDELGRFQPSEILLGGTSAEEPALKQAVDRRQHCCLTAAPPSWFDLDACRRVAESQFGALRADLHPSVIRAAGALLTILRENQKSDLPHVREMDYYLTGKFMDLDVTARRNLELTQTLRSGEKRGSLLWVLDHTKTALGSRLLRAWLDKPLLDPRQIDRRLDAVQELVGDTVAREELLVLLRQVTDLERVEARIVTGTCSCRDLRQLSNGAQPLPEIKQALGRFQSALLRELTERGLVCSVLPDDLIRDWKNVCGVPLDFSSGSSTQKLVWNKAVPLSSAASDFLDFARDYFAGKEAPEAPPEAPSKEAGGLSSNFFAELLDLPACKSKGYCDGCGRCEH